MKKRKYRYNLIHIQDPLIRKLWTVCCDQQSKDLITEDWHKVTCPKCIKIMIKMMRPPYETP